MSNFQIGQLFVKEFSGFRVAEKSEFKTDDTVYEWDGERIVERNERNEI